MAGFIAQYIDAVIEILAGAFCLYRVSHVPVMTRNTRIKVLAACGPVLLVVGVIHLFGAELGRSPRVWARHTTDDGQASAEFPGDTQRNTQEFHLHGVAISTIIDKFTDVRSGTTMMLSRSPLPPTQLSPDEVADDIIVALTQQGFVIDNRRDSSFGAVWGLSLKLHHKENKAAALLCVGVAHGSVYRALANLPSSASQEQDVRRFLDSFEIR